MKKLLLVVLMGLLFVSCAGRTRCIPQGNLMLCGVDEDRDGKVDYWQHYDCRWEPCLKSGKPIYVKE